VAFGGEKVRGCRCGVRYRSATLFFQAFQERKYAKTRLIHFGAISPEGGEILKSIGRVRCNVLISGGTGSGKTTLLNCMTNYTLCTSRVGKKG
jgi:pilus assembly protein CpaF